MSERIRPHYSINPPDGFPITERERTGDYG